MKKKLKGSDASSQKKTILIIDDDMASYLYIKKSLLFFNYLVTIARTGEEGLKILEREDYDAVIIDIFIRDINGVEIARRIREDKGKSLPIIGVTSTPLEVLKEHLPEGLSLFTKVFIKPFEYSKIMSLLTQSPPVHMSRKQKENLLETLIRDYQASIPERLALLDGLVQEIKKNLNEKMLKELELQIHNIAGHASLYGYDEVSKICKAFDKFLTNEIENYHQQADTSNLIFQLEVYLNKIKKGFNSTVSPQTNELERKIIEKTAIIGVIGLGNIGLSLLDAFGKEGFPLIGFDNKSEKVKMLLNKKSYLNHLDMTHLFSLIDIQRFQVSADSKILENADVLIISVPTSIDHYGTPNLSNLRAAFQTVASHLKKQKLVILQSSTYPGTTREELLPILSKLGLEVGVDFYLAHIPEIADIGNPEFNFTQIPRLVSGITPSCLRMASLLYEGISARIVPTSSTDIAEAAKLLQNSFRLVNISFVNEMKILFDKMNIDVWEVIAAAATKPFGFMPFYPSPGVGGDCIPITPFYLVWKAKATGGIAALIEESRRINDEMPHYVVNKLIEGLNIKKTTIRGAKILVLGVAYKKDINDIKESVALKIIPILKAMLANVDYHDPYIKTITQFPDHPELTMKSIDFDYNILQLYDAVLILTNHSCYNWQRIVKDSHLVIDTHNISASLIDKRKIIKA